MYKLLVKLLTLLSIVVIIFSCLQYKNTYDLQWLIIAMLGFILLLISQAADVLGLLVGAYLDKNDKLYDFLSFAKDIILEEKDAYVKKINEIKKDDKESTEKEV